MHPQKGRLEEISAGGVYVDFSFGDFVRMAGGFIVGSRETGKKTGG
jgi:hypothetical protein